MPSMFSVEHTYKLTHKQWEFPTKRDEFNFISRLVHDLLFELLRWCVRNGLWLKMFSLLVAFENTEDRHWNVKVSKWQTDHFLICISGARIVLQPIFDAYTANIVQFNYLIWCNPCDGYTTCCSHLTFMHWMWRNSLYRHLMNSTKFVFITINEFILKWLPLCFAMHTISNIVTLLPGSKLTKLTNKILCNFLNDFIFSCFSSFCCGHTCRNAKYAKHMRYIFA